MITYIATNTRNGRFYIGSTLDLERRKEEHLKCHDFPFQRSLRSDPTVFEWETWEDDSNEPVLEQALLDIWYGKEQCYNLSPFASRPPGNSGVPHTELTKQKISASMKGKNTGEANPSKREEVRQKISNSKKGISRPQEVKDKISKGCKGKRHWVDASGNRKFQEECPGEEWAPGMKWKG
jgi:group I intron endonuclease